MPVFIGYRGIRRQSLFICGIFQHVFKIVLDGKCKIGGYFLLIAKQEPKLAVTHKGVISVSIISGIIVTEFNIADSPTDVSPNTGPIYR